MMLGCMEILYDELNLAVPREKLVDAFGPYWTVHDICLFLAGYGYYKCWLKPQEGDIIFVGNHPGIIRSYNRVENIHHGRRTFWPLRRLRPEIVLRKSCQQQ
jgi:hypothetical protein